MKKMWMIAAIACAALMVACSSPEDKGKEFAEKINAAKGNPEQLLKLYDEADKYVETLKGDEKKEFEKAFDAAISKEVKAELVKALTDREAKQQ
jgi:hypothetical protein